MDHFAGMDVSVKETSVCILDDAGRIVKEVKLASEPQALLKCYRSTPAIASGSDIPRYSQYWIDLVKVICHAARLGTCDAGSSYWSVQ
jgi:hypothetical protein